MSITCLKAPTYYNAVYKVAPGRRENKSGPALNEGGGIIQEPSKHHSGEWEQTGTQTSLHAVACKVSCFKSTARTSASSLRTSRYCFTKTLLKPASWGDVRCRGKPYRVTKRPEPLADSGVGRMVNCLIEPLPPQGRQR